MTARRVLFVSALLLNFAGIGAYAASQSFEATVPATETNWTDTVSFPMFDPSLGLLNGVTVQVTGRVSGTAAYENRSSSSALIKLNLQAVISVSNPLNQGIATVAPTTTITEDAGPFDGNLDFGGASGGSSDDLSATETQTVSLQDSASLSAFTGSGQVSLGVSAEGTSDGMGSGNLALLFDTRAGVRVTISYEYSDAGACTGAIGNAVWEDLNANGVHNPHEPGIGGVRVLLTNGSGTTYPAVTDAGGRYSFSGLCSGAYRVGVDLSSLPGGSQLTRVGVGNPWMDSNPNPDAVFLRGDDSVNRTVDFGFILGDCSGVIGDLVWFDANLNGIQDPGETGIQGAEVALRDSEGQVIATASTDDSGLYRFRQLCGGPYSVEVIEESLPPGLFQSPKMAEADPATDSDGSPAAVMLDGNRRQDLTIDFGYGSTCESAIGDLIWNDLNGDGLQDEGEPGIPGVLVALLDGMDNALATTTTAANGRYSFTGVCPGSYRVRVDPSTVPAGLEETLQFAGADPAIDSNGDNATVTLESGSQADESIDIGFRSPCSGFIGDFAWHDLNENGLQNEGEPGINGIDVRLLNSDGVALQTATTTMSQGSNGVYGFFGICAGDYTVEIDTSSLPAGFEPTSGGGDSRTSPVAISFASDDAIDETVDFGFVAACTGEIGDFVWEDLNGDGIQDVGEPGLGGVEVRLRDPSDSTLLGTTVTNADGQYRFTGLCRGDYKVEVVPPDGFALSPAGTGAPEEDSNPNPSIVFLKPEKLINDTIDFGFVPAIGGVCPLSQGFWKNHAGDWPVETLSLGEESYGKLEMLVLLNTPVKGDASVILAHQLIAAKLNGANGADTGSISGSIAEADDLLGGGGLIPQNVSPSSDLGRQMVSVAEELDDFNNSDPSGCAMMPAGPPTPGDEVPPPGDGDFENKDSPRNNGNGNGNSNGAAKDKEPGNGNSNKNKDKDKDKGNGNDNGKSGNNGKGKGKDKGN